MTAITVYRQFLAALSANLIGFSFGWMSAWANANYDDLKSNSTTKTQLQDGPITLNQASLVMSLICAGGLVGNIVYLFVLNKFGRKNPILFLAVPAIFSWLFIIFAENVYWLYASRILCGFVGGALFISVPVFVSEICQDEVRGTVNALGFVVNAVGSLVGFIVAIFFDFRVQAVCALIVPFLFVFVFYFVPDSPMSLYNKNKIELADLALEFYKGANNNNMSPESEKIMVEEKKCEKNDDSGISIKDFVTTRAARRAVSIAILLVLLPQISGCYILLSYTTSYFIEAESRLSPIESSILVCIVQLVANLFTMFLVDKIGRKILFTLSSMGTGLGLFVLAMHNMYKHLSSNFVPIYGLSLTIFIASIGLIPIPFVITVDVLPPKIRNITMTMTSITMWCVGFFMNFAYISMLQVIELHGCLLVFSAGCFICAMYGLIFIPETKGKSPDCIVKLLEKS
ncbi:facilitated trehalose transporter Tret1-like [Contarinia nasturtii]|uniref:facilitated trehalose transporter Tret1-like n=1 Tax=Contarinia nasturtii TaxID=265458 RepID=UPI0012D411F8|nr:facilitated trehalose transporter Tret1-like [Contarinia nasturtii]